MRISDWSSDVCSSDLQAIFSEPPWSPRDATGAGDPAHYWGPLIALYHGLRRGEIAQLAPQDVKEIEKVWVMRVRGERLKTINAPRTIPVHPELQRPGFLRFVEQQRQAGPGLPFPLQAPNKREPSAVPTRRWFRWEERRVG